MMSQNTKDIYIVQEKLTVFLSPCIFESGKIKFKTTLKDTEDNNMYKEKPDGIIYKTKDGNNIEYSVVKHDIKYDIVVKIIKTKQILKLTNLDLAGAVGEGFGVMYKIHKQECILFCIMHFWKISLINMYSEGKLCLSIKISNVIQLGQMFLNDDKLNEVEIDCDSEETIKNSFKRLTEPSVEKNPPNYGLSVFVVFSIICIIIEIYFDYINNSEEKIESFNQ